MKRMITQFTITLVWVSFVQCAIADDVASVAKFEKPVRLKTAAGDLITTTGGAGHACPCYVDVTGDGKKDLLVGQLSKGQIALYENLGKARFSDRRWIMDGDKPAVIKDVW